MKTKQTTIHRPGAKWLPGAMALAATTASSQAATVQITLSGNKLTSLGVNTLNADVTGDGNNDLLFANVGFSSKNAVVVINGGAVYASKQGVRFYANAAFRFNDGVGMTNSYVRGFSAVSALFLNRVTFTDARVNGGSLTNGWLEVHAFNSSATSHTVELTRLIFNDASATLPAFTSIPGAQTAWVPGAAIPEPSSFALLGLGAAGLLARRRRQAA